jgi:hypothetical protein
LAVTVTPYITKNGVVAVFFTDASTGNFSNVTAVGQPPQFFLNGSATALNGQSGTLSPTMPVQRNERRRRLGSTGSAQFRLCTIPPDQVRWPVWQNSTKDCPFVFFKLPVTLQPTDTLTMTVPASWATCAAGAAPASTLQAVANYIGQYEPSVGNYGGVAFPGFNLPKSQWTCQGGYNMSWPGHSQYDAPYSPWANWMKRGGTPAYTSNVSTSDSHRHPLTLSATSTWKFLRCGDSPNNVDSRGVPTPQGVWTLVADETTPGTPMTVAIPNTVTNCTVTFLGITPGTIDGVTGYEVGKKWQWNIVYTAANPTSYGAIIAINFSGIGPGGSGPWSLKNECFLAPGNSARPAQPWALDQNVVNWLTTPNGRTPAYLRWMDCLNAFDGISSCVDPSDRRDSNDFLWESHGTTANVTAIRHFDPSVSTVTWWSQHWPNSTQPGGGPTGAPNAIPTSAGMLKINPGANEAGWYMFESVYDNSSLQLKSGQNIGFASSGFNNIPCSNGNQANTTVNLNSAGVTVFMTGPNSFVATAFRGGFANATGQPALINNVVGSIPVTGTLTITLPDISNPGHKAAAFGTGTLNNTNFWCNLSVSGTDAYVVSVINDVLDIFPAGRKILIEYGNENWSLFGNYFPPLVLGNAAAIDSRYTNQLQNRIMRTAQVHNICRQQAALRGRQNEIIGWFGGWLNHSIDTSDCITFINTYNVANPGGLLTPTVPVQRSDLSRRRRAGSTGLVQWKGATNPGPIQVDAFGPTAYLNATVTDTTTTRAAASILSQDARSAAYGEPFPWTRAQYWDLGRHYARYNTTYNGPAGIFAQHRNNLNAYVPVNNQGAGFKIPMIAYECGTDRVVNVNAAAWPGNQALIVEIGHDLAYDPAFADFEIAQFMMAQSAGYSAITTLNLCMPGRLVNGGAPDLWGTYTWAGQKPGPGDGSTGGAVNKFYADTGQCQDFTNDNPRGFAWQTWVDAANAPGQSPLSWRPNVRKLSPTQLWIFHA